MKNDQSAFCIFSKCASVLLGQTCRERAGGQAQDEPQFVPTCVQPAAAHAPGSPISHSRCRILLLLQHAQEIEGRNRQGWSEKLVMMVGPCELAPEAEGVSKKPVEVKL